MWDLLWLLPHPFTGGEKETAAFINTMSNQSWRKRIEPSQTERYSIVAFALARTIPEDVERAL